LGDKKTETFTQRMVQWLAIIAEAEQRNRAQAVGRWRWCLHHDFSEGVALICFRWYGSKS
jgi:hypothetical protein